MKRPEIVDIKTGAIFRQWYWLKEELVAYCKKAAISYTGSKLEITNRIPSALDGDVHIHVIGKKKKQSSVNWAASQLTLQTVITDSYTNGPNTRKFFQKHCGNQFHFSIPFMKWMKDNEGKTLAQAVAVWKTQYEERKNKRFKTVIPGSNQYNRYMRDFFADNPGRSVADARRFWKLKRSLPGEPVYDRGDLLLV